MRKARQEGRSGASQPILPDQRDPRRRQSHSWPRQQVLRELNVRLRPAKRSCERVQCRGAEDPVGSETGGALEASYGVLRCGAVLPVRFPAREAEAGERALEDEDLCPSVARLQRCCRSRKLSRLRLGPRSGCGLCRLGP